MASSEPTSRGIPLDDAIVMVAGDVMMANPKTYPTDVLVGDVRRAFERPSVRIVLLTENGVFRGAIERAGLPDDAPEDRPAAQYADTQPSSATPAMPMVEALAILERCNEPRLIVLDDDGATLRGLLCFNRSSKGFCV